MAQSDGQRVDSRSGWLSDPYLHSPVVSLHSLSSGTGGGRDECISSHAFSCLELNGRSHVGDDHVRL